MPFLRSAFFTVALGIVSTLALSRAFSPSLTVKTSIGDASNDLDDGFQMLQNVTVIIATVTTCDETLILLNDPRGVLNALPVTGTFMIVDVESGSRRPLCGGIMFKYSPTYAARLDDPSAFTVLAPGASINVTHTPCAGFEFSRSDLAGRYYYHSISPFHLFTYVDDDGTPKDFYSVVEDVAVVRLSDDFRVFCPECLYYDDPSQGTFTD